MTKEEFAALLLNIQSQERSVFVSGQSEYVHDDSNCFANFDRAASSLRLSREQVLMTYLLKHIDGIISYVNGHKSQREDVRGRIKDARMCLALLWGMIENGDRTVRDRAPRSADDMHCHADRDGDCQWRFCPQTRDNEPHTSGRHCPLDTGDAEE